MKIPASIRVRAATAIKPAPAAGQSGLQRHARTLLMAGIFLFAGSPAIASQWITGSFGNFYGLKYFNAFIPTSYSPGTPMPLVLAIHGCTQNSVSFAGATRFNTLAEAHGFIVVYPDQPYTANPYKCWNVQYPINQARGSGEPSILNGMVSWMKTYYNIDPKRVFVTGFSSGGAMSSIMLSCYPDVFAAGSVNAGLMYAASSSDAEQAATLLYGSVRDPDTQGDNAYTCGNSLNLIRPVVVFHGTWDPVVNPFNGNQIIAQFAQTNDRADDGSDNDSVTATWTSQTQGQVAGGRPYHINNFVFGGSTLMQEYRIYGMGHAWSGGNPAYGYADASGPDASLIQWAFFSANPRP